MSPQHQRPATALCTDPSTRHLDGNLFWTGINMDGQVKTEVLKINSIVSYEMSVNGVIWMFVVHFSFQNI